MANFKTRHNLSKFTISGESVSISADAEKAARYRSSKVLKAFAQKHGWHNIWNLDEKALFYKLLPNTTLADCKVSGIKMDKKRLSIAFLVNASGTELINPIVIGHNKKPRSFGNWNPNSIVGIEFLAQMILSISKKIPSHL